MKPFWYLEGKTCRKKVVITEKNGYFPKNRDDYQKSTGHRYTKQTKAAEVKGGCTKATTQGAPQNARNMALLKPHRCTPIVYS